MDHEPGDTVRAFFASMQARDWEAAASCLADDVHVWYPATDEHFTGDAFLGMQRAYPEGWSISVHEVLSDGDRVAARVAVDQAGERFWCAGTYRVVAGRIAGGVELWVTEGGEEPPAWRAAFTSPRERPAPEAGRAS